MIEMNLGGKYYDEANEVFIDQPQILVKFEHTLKSMFEWEGIYQKPFLKTEMTKLEFSTYIKLMADQPLDDEYIDDSLIMTIKKYLDVYPSATKLNMTEKSSNKTVTSEMLYASLAEFNLDPEYYDKWNLNRLLILLSVIVANKTPKKKKTMKEIYEENNRLNEQRKQMYKTKG